MHYCTKSVLFICVLFYVALREYPPPKTRCKFTNYFRMLIYFYRYFTKKNQINLFLHFCIKYTGNDIPIFQCIEEIFKRPLYQQ